MSRSDPIEVDDDAPPSMVVDPPPPRTCAELKLELRRVLNAFQSSSEFGLYVCEAFRDPRRSCIDHYWDEVEDQASGILALGELVGSHRAPLSPEAAAAFAKFARTLHSLADRVDAVLTG